MTYIPLPTSIARRGYLLTQIKRTKKAAMYRVEGAGVEVWKVRKAERCEIKDKKTGKVNIIEAREVGPSDEQFGNYGWYYMVGAEDAAEKKYREIR